MRNFFLVLLVVFFVVISFQNAFSWVLTYDTLILYEKGQKIEDTNVVVVTQDGESIDICVKGRCLIVTGVTEAVLYKTDKAEILDYNAWQKETGKDKSGYTAYLRHLIQSAVYSTKVLFPELIDIPSPTNAIGGMYLPRWFNVDIRTGKVELYNNGEKNSGDNSRVMGVSGSVSPGKRLNRF